MSQPHRLSLPLAGRQSIFQRRMRRLRTSQPRVPPDLTRPAVAIRPEAGTAVIPPAAGTITNRDGVASAIRS